MIVDRKENLIKIIYFLKIRLEINIKKSLAAKPSRHVYKIINHSYLMKIKKEKRKENSKEKTTIQTNNKIERITINCSRSLFFFIRYRNQYVIGLKQSSL